ncbi:YfgM family protein [Rheinheimera sp. MMS21-TC3]|uniref:YfgM family protein n=1 Tax=Rheinheimera sp. MMS21-TC3 TaxID=3072790 RepID=UPI0028C4C4E3|nr:tetratricopeptide repeat protein [Rheinheimera sp. MMS21-TC3]WNO60262.1 tetratricopeptide repeat protein [Rheinheimera sp. MMS21-TC3]
MEIYSSEEQQVEAIKRFWNTYGKAILGGVVLGFVVLYGFRYYQAQQRNNVEQASAGFSQLLLKRETAQDDNWLAQAQGFIDSSKSENYAVLAALLAAKDAVVAEDLELAAKQLSWVLEHAKEPALLALTQLRLARVQKEQTNFDAALATLAKPVPDSFKALQAELKGDILLLSDKPAQAKTAYQQALNARGENQQLLQVKLDELAHITAA